MANRASATQLGPFQSAAFCDLQVNGFAGTDFNTPHVGEDGYNRAIEALWKTGVTRFLPTIITASDGDMCRCLRAAARAAELSRIGASIAGIHLEGPWISPEAGPRGAHPLQHVRAPDIEEFRRFQDAAGGRIRLVTLAPEWPGAPAMIAWLVEHGVHVAIGHTAATAAQIAEAVGAGARLSTHLGNGCAEMLHRHHNPIWAQLACDQLNISLIVDGHHLPPAVVKSMIRAKGVERVFLVTDASAPAATSSASDFDSPGCAPGTYTLGETQVELTDTGRVVMHGATPPSSASAFDSAPPSSASAFDSAQRLAGSALRMDQAVANTVRFAGVSWEQALAMAGPQAAAAIGLSFPDDRVILESVGDDIVIHKVIREGELLWQNTS
jgi:N-acetylglucosamine-6-phosphate deacetylase